MTDSCTVYVDGVGPVTLKHSNRVEKTTLTATPDKGVRVSVPVNVSFDTAIEFVNQNEHWISAYFGVKKPPFRSKSAGLSESFMIGTCDLI
jgi:predicted metal-dependent hydrolase